MVKICNVIAIVCRTPSYCQYCSNGFFYTEKHTKNNHLANQSLDTIFQEAETDGLL